MGLKGKKSGNKQACFVLIQLREIVHKMKRIIYTRIMTALNDHGRTIPGRDEESIINGSIKEWRRDSVSSG